MREEKEQREKLAAEHASKALEAQASNLQLSQISSQHEEQTQKLTSALQEHQAQIQASGEELKASQASIEQLKKQIVEE